MPTKQVISLKENFYQYYKKVCEEGQDQWYMREVFSSCVLWLPTDTRCDGLTNTASSSNPVLGKGQTIKEAVLPDLAQNLDSQGVRMRRLDGIGGME